MTNPEFQAMLAFMENPRVINRFLFALLVGFTFVALGCSLYYREIFIFFGWLAIIVLFLAVCGFLAVFNIAIFAPIFRLLARLDAKTGSTKNSKADETDLV